MKLYGPLNYTVKVLLNILIRLQTHLFSFERVFLFPQTISETQLHIDPDCFEKLGQFQEWVDFKVSQGLDI